jgi:hypothetical protein
MMRLIGKRPSDAARRLVQQYGDLCLGLADPSLVVLAHRFVRRAC